MRQSLKYQMFTPSRCKDVGIRKKGFVINAQLIHGTLPFKPLDYRKSKSLRTAHLVIEYNSINTIRVHTRIYMYNIYCILKRQENSQMIT